MGGVFPAIEESLLDLGITRKQVYVDLRPHELSQISHYLKTAYRNDNGSGIMVIGQVEDEWHTLSNELQVEEALAMGHRLAEENVHTATIYDVRRRLQIQFRGGKIRQPLRDSGR